MVEVSVTDVDKKDQTVKPIISFFLRGACLGLQYILDIRARRMGFLRGVIHTTLKTTPETMTIKATAINMHTMRMRPTIPSRNITGWAYLLWKRRKRRC